VPEPAPDPVLDPARIDVLRGIGAADGWGLLPAVAAGFLEDGSAHLAALQAAVRTADRGALAERAHSLKGTAANIGAVQVAALCADLEALGRAGEAAATPEVLDRLETELHRAQRALAGLLPGAP
jgi:HPt (histidine-containing phosphotransfer) domain-containing protein